MHFSLLQRLGRTGPGHSAYAGEQTARRRHFIIEPETFLPAPPICAGEAQPSRIGSALRSARVISRIAIMTQTSSAADHANQRFAAVRLITARGVALILLTAF